MAEPNTNTVDPELLKRLLDPDSLRALADPSRHTDLALTEANEAARPRVASITPEIGAAPNVGGGTLPSLSSSLGGEPKGLPILSTKQQKGLPMLSPGVTAGSAADYENQLERLRAPTTPATTTLGKIGHGLAKIGNIALDVAAPGIAMNIPGTDMFKRAEIHAIEPRLAAAQKEESEAPLRKAQTENIASEIRARENPQPKPKEEEWSVVPNVTGPNGEPVQQEKTSGQIRVAPLPGAKETGKPGTDEQQFVQKYLKDKNLPDTAENRLAAATEYKGGAPIGDTDAKQITTQIANALKGTGIDAGGYAVTPKSTRGEANEALKAAQNAANEQRTRTAPELAQNRKDARTMGYAIDQKGELKYMSKADADKIHSTFEELKPADVNKDRQAIRQLNDVQMNTSRYRKAIDGLREDLSPLAVTNMTTILSDKGFGAKIEPFGVGIDLGMVNDAIKGTAVASAWNALKPEERNVLIGYLRAKSSVLAYQKALTGIGRTNKEQLEIEMNNLPLPFVGATVAGQQMTAWQENVDRASEGFPTNLPGIKSTKQVRQEAEGGGQGHNFTVNGVQYQNVSDDDYAKAKKLKGFKE